MSTRIFDTLIARLTGYFGNRLCFGTFSDGKLAVLRAELCTLFHTVYWLKVNLENYPFINLNFDANYVYWQKEEYVFQRTFLFFGSWVKSVTGFYRLNRNCVLETHKNGQWIKV